MALRYFLDTYAIIEIVKGNANYKKYLEAESFTSLLNLYELYYYLLRDMGEKKAKELFFQFRNLVIPIKDEYIFLASAFKRKHKDVSYADALGYVMATQNKAKFLTGDSAFQNISQVQFVK